MEIIPSIKIPLRFKVAKTKINLIFVGQILFYKKINLSQSTNIIERSITDQRNPKRGLNVSAVFQVDEFQRN
jgi:hypothetical protein